MVRAAVTGAFDYTGSDPTNKHWRLRHRLIISELLAGEDLRLFESLHRHWLGYVAHGGLTEESFADVKERAAAALGNIKNSIFPWDAEEPPAENENEQNDTIKPEYQDMIERYKRYREQRAKEKTEAQS